MDSITLSVWERLYLIQLGNLLPRIENKFSAYDYKKLLKFFDKVELSEDEEDQVGLRRLEPQGFSWEDTKALFEIELSRNDNEILEKIKNIMKTGPLPQAEPKSIVGLADKLGIYEENTE